MKTKFNAEKSGPTFLVIGAQKCGTTWLGKMLCQHPQVCGPAKKELHFFNKPENYQKGLKWYIRQFSTVPCAKATGEFTPNYFWTYDGNKTMCDQNILEDIPKLVHDFNPDMKLILLIRNPVNRAISAYYHHIRKGRISPHEKILDVKDIYGIQSMGLLLFSVTRSPRIKKWYGPSAAA